MQVVYLVLAVVGLCATWFFNVQFMMEGSSLGFVEAAMINNAASSMTVDILVVAVAGLVWIFVESKRVGMRFAWVYVPLTFLVAFAFAFPLFLYLRERHLVRESTAA